MSTLNNTTSTLQPSPIKLNDEFLVLVLIMYALVFLFGILGNGFTCFAVLTDRTMRRSIHFYTFNMAVADMLLLLLYVPSQMEFVRQRLRWTMGLSMCKIGYCIIPLCLSASIGTLVAISIDRYIGMTRPFVWRAASSRNAKFVIFFIWIFSGVTAFPAAYFAKVITYESIVYCYEDWPEPRHYFESSYWSFIMIIQYVIPLFLITGVHIRMVYVLYTEKRAENELHQRMIRMVIMLLLIYSVCTGMQHINFYLSVYKQIHLEPFGDYLYVVSNFLVALQATVNPMIYGISRNDYKNIFKTTLKKYTKYIKGIMCNQSAPTNSIQCNATTKNILHEEEQVSFVSIVEPSMFSNSKKDSLVGINTSKSTDVFVDSKGYLHVPKRTVRKKTLRFDTLCYYPDDEYESHITRSSCRKKNKQYTEEITCDNQSTVNRKSTNLYQTNHISAFHPVIIITPAVSNQSTKDKSNASLNPPRKNLDLMYDDFNLAFWDYSELASLLDEAPESRI